MVIGLDYGWLSIIDGIKCIMSFIAILVTVNRYSANKAVGLGGIQGTLPA
jgi:hypothetical protein